MSSPVQSLASAPDVLDIMKESWAEGVYELVAAGAVYGVLDYKAWSGNARGQTPDGTWKISRAKGLGSHQEVHDEADRLVVDVSLSFWTSSGTVVLGGREYRLSTPAWGGRAVTVLCGDVTLLELKPSFWGAGKDKGDVLLHDAGRQDPNASLLLLLALDSMIRHQRRQGAAAGAGA